MSTPLERRNYILYLLREQLTAENGAHKFEHISRETARRRIASNIIPATGPVSAGGDAGRDFETFRSYLSDALGEHNAFAALVSKETLAFACTLQKKNIAQKLADDVEKIVSSGTRVHRVYGMCASDVSIAQQHKLKQTVKDAHGVELEVLDGQWIAEQLADADLYWVAKAYLSAPEHMAPPHAVSSPVVEDRSTDWSEPPQAKKYEEMQVAFGESPDAPESFRTLAEIVAEQREVAKEGDAAGAFETLASAALDLHEWALSEVALEVLDELREMVPPGTMEPLQDAWLLNTRALALARLGKADEANELWRRMLTMGERLQDQELRAIALQNLAIADVDAERSAEAKERVRESMQLMRDLGRTRSMVQLLNNLASINIDEEHYDEAASQLDAYEEIARAVGDLPLLVSARGNRGRLLAQQGRLTEAEAAFREALKLARKVGDPVREIVGLQNMGKVSLDQGRPGVATRWYRKAIRLAEAHHLPVQVEVLQRSLGGALHEAGRHRDAIRAFDAARQAAWQFGDRALWAQSTMNLGAAYVLLGEGGVAIDPLSQAASTFRELGEFDWEIRALENMAAAYQASGQPEAAIAVLERAVPLADVHDHERRADLLTRAAEVCLKDGQLLKRAVGLFTKATAEEDAFLATGEAARRAARVATLLRRQGAAEDALPFADRAVSIAPAEPTEGYGLADALNDRALDLVDLERHDEARTDLLRCIELCEASADSRLLQTALANLAEVERLREDRDAAVQAARRAERLAHELDDTEALVHCLKNLGLALEDADQLDEAEATWRELLELGETHGVWEWHSLSLFGQARTAFIRRDYGTAAARYAAVASSGELPDYIFALGGQLESLSAAGELTELEECAQKLVDAVKASGYAYEAITFLGRSAISWLKQGNHEEAVSLLEVGVRLGVNAYEPADEESAESEAGITPVVAAVMFVPIAAKASESDERALSEAVLSQLSNTRTDLAELVRPLLDIARDAVPLSA